jgi:hypothetical protein
VPATGKLQEIRSREKDAEIALERELPGRKRMKITDDDANYARRDQKKKQEAEVLHIKRTVWESMSKKEKTEFNKKYGYAIIDDE